MLTTIIRNVLMIMIACSGILFHKIVAMVNCSILLCEMNMLVDQGVRICNSFTPPCVCM